MIYLDHSATTPPRNEIIDYYRELAANHYGNASAVYTAGRQAAVLIKQARRRIADVIGIESDRIYFSSGATESNNHIIFSAICAARRAGTKPHIITSKLEHPSVLEPLAHFHATNAADISFLPVNAAGRVCAENLLRLIRQDTVLVSICAVSSEIGIIQPIQELAQQCRAAGVPFHSDFTQGMRCPDVRALLPACDLATFSGHKLYGLKGIGVTVATKELLRFPLLHGGGQERGQRAGTENLPLIGSLALALELLVMDTVDGDLSERRDRLHRRITEKSRQFTAVGDFRYRAGFHLCYTVNDVSAEKLIIALDMAGVQASSGSACATGNRKVSEAMLAVGHSPEAAEGMLRLTLGRGNQENEIDRAADIITETVAKLAGNQNRLFSGGNN